MVIDLRQIIFATLWKKYEKKLVTDEIKDEIRTGTATYKFADYGNVKLKDYTQSEYTEEDQKKIDEFIKENHIEKVKKVKTNYSIEFIPSEKAIKVFENTLDKLVDSQIEDLKDAVTMAQNAIQEYKDALYEDGDVSTATAHAEYYINSLAIELNKLYSKQPKHVAKIAEKVKSIM